MALVFEKKGGVPAAPWKELVHGKLLTVEDVEADSWRRTPDRTRVSSSIRPFEIVVLQAP